MNLKSNKKQIFISLWWLLEAYVLYYYWGTYELGIKIVSLLLIIVSCLLFLFQSYRIQAALYLFLSIYSILFLLGMYVLYWFSSGTEQHVWYYFFILLTISVNLFMSFRGFWNNWKKCLPLP